MQLLRFPPWSNRIGQSILVLALFLTVQCIGLPGAEMSALADQSQVLSLNNEGVKALNASNYQLAIAKFEEALKQDPNYELARDNLAIAYNNYGLQLRGQPKEALKQFHKSRYLNPSNPTTSQDIEGLIRMMGKNPRSFQDRVDLGDQAQLSGDLVGAIVEFEAALAIKNDPKIHTKLADVYRVRGEDDKAAREDAEAANPSAGAKSDTSGSNEKDRGDSAKSEDQAALNAAVSERNAAIAKDPLDPKNHIGLGLAYQNRGDFGQAEAEYRMALKFSPGHRNPVAERLIAALPAAKQQAEGFKHTNGGVDLQARKLYDQAIAEYKMALRTDPNNASIWVNIGTAFQAKQDYQNAVQAYRQALAIDHNNQAAQQGTKSATEQQENTMIGEAWKSGGTLFQQGKYQEAADKYLAVLRVAPQDPATHFCLGATYQAMKKIDMAIAEYRLAEQYDSKNKQYQQAYSDAMDLKVTGGAAELASRENMPMQKVLEVLPDVERFESEKARRQAVVARDYLAQTKSSLEQAWHSPPHTGLKITKLKITLGSSGHLEKSDLLYASGSPPQDQSVLDLVQSYSFAALPADLKTLDLSLSFMSDGGMNMVDISLSPAQPTATTDVGDAVSVPSPLSVGPPHIGGEEAAVAPAPIRMHGGGGRGTAGPAIAVVPSVPRQQGGGGSNGITSNQDANNNEHGRPTASAQTDVDFGPYMADLQRRIKQHWLSKGYEGQRVVVQFKIHKGGEISNLRLEHSSGVALADQAALKAVEESSPCRPLPVGASSDVDIQFTFDYHVFGNGCHGVFRQF